MDNETKPHPALLNRITMSSAELCWLQLKNKQFESLSLLFSYFGGELVFQKILNLAILQCTEICSFLPSRMKLIEL